MKTIDVTSFKALVQRSDWESSISCEIIQTDSRVEGMYSENGPKEIYFSWGIVRKTLILEDMKVTVSETWDADYNDPESYSASAEGMPLDDVFTYDGPDVLNEDGEKLDLSEIVDLLPAQFHRIDFVVKLA